MSSAADQYDFASAVSTLMLFCEATSSDYFTAFKDVLYCDAPQSSRRVQAQYMLGLTLQVMMRLLVPVLPYTAEEVFQALKGHLEFAQESSVLLTGNGFVLPEVQFSSMGTYDALKELKREVNQYVEAQLSAPVEGGLKVKSPAQLALTVTSPVPLNTNDVQDYLGCAELTVQQGASFAVGVSPTTRPLCPRCRSHRTLLFTGLCDRCETVEAAH